MPSLIAVSLLYVLAAFSMLACFLWMNLASRCPWPHSHACVYTYNTPGRRSSSIFYQQYNDVVIGRLGRGQKVVLRQADCIHGIHVSLLIVKTFVARPQHRTHVPFSMEWGHTVVFTRYWYNYSAKAALPLCMASTTVTAE